MADQFLEQMTRATSLVGGDLLYIRRPTNAAGNGGDYNLTYQQLLDLVVADLAGIPAVGTLALIGPTALQVKQGQAGFLDVEIFGRGVVDVVSGDPDPITVALSTPFDSGLTVTGYGPTQAQQNNSFVRCSFSVASSARLGLSLCNVSAALDKGTPQEVRLTPITVGIYVRAA